MEQQQKEIHSTLGLKGDAHHRRPGRWGWLLAIIIVLLLGYLLLPSGQKSGNVQYKTIAVSRGDLTLTVTATGTLQPLNQVEVGSELSGTIASVVVDFNDEVEVGQVLAQLDTSTLESRIVEAKASLRSAQAKVKEAEATELEMATALKRCRELAKQKMCSQNDVDASVAAHARAKAGVASARAQVSIAEASLDGQLTNLAKATIRSPIKGIVLDRKVEPGQTVAASFQTPELFTLAEDLSRMELLVAIDEADIGRIRQGQSASFNVDAFTNRQFSATITQVRRAPQTVEGVVSYETVLGVENSGLELLPGMTATAEITTREVKDAILIPNAALRYSPPVTEPEASQGGSLLSRLFPRRRHSRPIPAKGGEGGEREVWKLVEDEPQPITITVGESDGMHTELLQGELEPGVALITESTQVKP